MALFKCKMCGGNIEFKPGDTVGTCDSCGSTQTLPKVNDDVITNLFNRANNLRLKAEFDKASAIYEKIVNEDNTNAEAHWGIVLCKYGIEYVEDPATYKRVPTCHRTQYESIMTDVDYIAALENCDTTQQSIYTQQALEISNIQKGILAIVKEEKPFDVFICYKETDENGKRTVDSVLANDIYYQLTQEGLKVFYAAITLEDKLGQEYEPYIFAALNSAKVMLVVGTKPEYFEAVWVRNEWSRFMKIMKNDRSKLLIPCYRDMDAYDLPEDFSHLQAQDMSKIGFVNDVVRGIKKVIDGSQPKSQVVNETTVINNAVSANIDALLKRAFMFLEDGKWQDADEYCEKVLDQNPECAEAYLGKLMAELNVKTKDAIKNYAQPFDNLDNCKKASRFDSAIADKLAEDNKFIRERNENARLTRIYNNAVSLMKTTNTEEDFKAIALVFEPISGFKDADEKAKECLEKAEVCRKDAVYADAYTVLDDSHFWLGKKDVKAFESSIEKFKSISGWKDADEQIYACQRKIEEIKAKEEADRIEAKRKAEAKRIADEKAAKKRKKIIAITTPIVCVCIAFLIVLTTVIIPSSKYNSAMKLYNAGKYQDAYMAFNEVSYKDSNDKASECLFLIQKSNLSNVKKGDTVKFGSYEQDNDTSNGKEEIEWRVLAKEDNRILVISEYAIDCKQYNTEYEAVTWETSTLRKWLNNDFLNEAFGTEHQKLIPSVSVSADKNPKYSTNPGNATTDKVFLLSITEAEKYFTSDEDRKCVPTAYAKAQGAYTSSGGKATCWWWLRSPGYNQDCAAGVLDGGSVGCTGLSVGDDDDCVRPALWISLDF